MKRQFFLVCRLVLAFAGFLYTIELAGAAAIEKSTDIGGPSPWSSVLLSVVVLLGGFAALTYPVAQPGERPAPQTTSDVQSSISIVAICCLGLLSSLFAAIFYGLDLGVSLP